MRAGQSVKATENWNAALSSAQEIKGPISQADVLMSIVLDQATGGQVAEALRTAQKITDSQFHAHALGSIAEAQAAAGNFAEALRTVQNIGDQGDEKFRSSALRSIAFAQAKAHQWRVARKTVALCLARDRLGAYTAILTEYAKANNPKLKHL